MCLDTVDKQPRRTRGKGWKVTSVDSYDHAISEWTGHRYKLGGWEKDYNTGKIRSPDGQYPAGFHVWLDKPDYRGINVRQVYFRNVVATGTQSYRKVVVAREIYMLKRSEETNGG